MFSENDATSSKILRVAQVIGFLGLIIIVAYVLVLTKNFFVVSFLAMLCFALAVPVYTTINRISSWKSYILNLFAPIIGLYVSIMFWIIDVGIVLNELETLIFPSVFMITSLCVIFPILYYTRKMSVIKGKIEKDEFVHNSGTLIAIIVIGAFVAFTVSDVSRMDVGNIALVSLILGLYAFSSSFTINSAFRRHELEVALETEDTANKIKTLKKSVVKNFPEKSDERDFLVYLLERLTSSFVSGDFERCFIDAMTIICDETVVKPKKYVDKLLENEQQERFRKIRVALVHSIIYDKKKEGEKTKEIMSKKKHLEVKSDLYQNCIEIQKVVFEVVSSFCQEKEKTSKNM